MIPEIGRCLVGKSALCEKKTLKKIFEIHNELLVAVKNDPPTPIVIWDTDNVTTLSYLTFLYAADANGISDVMGERNVMPADKYFFFESNIDFCDDGTRLEAMEAIALSTHHKRLYSDYGIELEEVVTDDRCETVRQYILHEIETLKGSFE